MFIGPAPDPESGLAHEGYRGYIGYDEIGVHLRAREVAFGPSLPRLPTDEVDEHGWVWECIETDLLYPWHMVHSISWGSAWAL